MQWTRLTPKPAQQALRATHVSSFESVSKVRRVWLPLAVSPLVGSSPAVHFMVWGFVSGLANVISSPVTQCQRRISKGWQCLVSICAAAIGRLVHRAIVFHTNSRDCPTPQPHFLAPGPTQVVRLNLNVLANGCFSSNIRLNRATLRPGLRTHP